MCAQAIDEDFFGETPSFIALDSWGQYHSFYALSFMVIVSAALLPRPLGLVILYIPCALTRRFFLIPPTNKCYIYIYIYIICISSMCKRKAVRSCLVLRLVLVLTRVAAVGFLAPRSDPGADPGCVCRDTSHTGGSPCRVGQRVLRVRA